MNISAETDPCNANELNYLFTEGARLFYLCSLVTRLLITITTIIFNFMFIAALLTDKHLKNNISKKLMMILSVIDLLQGFLCWPIAIYLNTGWLYLERNCLLSKILYSLGYILSFATITVVFLIALDQYLAIVHPFFYISQVTLRRLLVPWIPIHLALCVFNFIGRFMSLKVWHLYRYVIAVMIFAIMLVLAYVHLGTIKQASIATKKINKTNKEEAKQIKLRAQASRSTLIVFLATVLCYLPLITYNAYESVGKRTSFSKTFLKLPAEMITLSTSVIDPIVYFCRLRCLRIAAKKILHTPWCKNKVSVSP